MKSIIGLMVLAAPAAAWAHTATDPITWAPEPWIALMLAVTAALYAVGARRRPPPPLRILAFVLGWLALAGAAASPLHQAGARSFTLHMVEHEIMMLVAAPLFVLAHPTAALLRALPGTGRAAFGGLTAATRAVWRLLAAPVPVTLLQAAALWFWHAPGLFDLALGAESWHIAQHLSFFVAALLFWHAMFRTGRAQPGLGALCLFATSVVTGALGALMAFSQSPWYEPYTRLGMAPFGLTAAEDQQLAGLLMWIPGGLVHAGAAFAIVLAALRRQTARPNNAGRADLPA